MFFKRILAKILRRRLPEELFAEARELFAEHEYKFAYVLFKKAERGFHGIDLEMEQKSAISAATCASFLDLEHEAGQHLFRAARLSISLERPLTETIHLVDKAAKAMLSTENAKANEIAEILTTLYISHIANNDLPRARKVALNPKLEGPSTRSQVIAALDQLVQERSPLLQSYEMEWDLLPEEFSTLSEGLDSVLRGYTSLKPRLIPPKHEVYDVKNPLEVCIELKSSEKICINHISLRTGSKGSIVDRPKFETDESHILPGESQSYAFVVEAHLPGEWTIGPGIIEYELGPNLQFEIETEECQIMVRKPTPILYCGMKLEEAAEAHQCRLIIELENKGPGIVEDLRIALSIPDGLSILDGTQEKQLASLAPSQNFSYEIGLRSDVAFNMLSGKEILMKLNHSPVEGITQLKL
ncbi:MAG: hypothetical protein ACXAEL_01890 [Candidatus Hodarchaeales archaeon]